MIITFKNIEQIVIFILKNDLSQILKYLKLFQTLGMFIIIIILDNF
jgi:hypothetical protein